MDELRLLNRQQAEALMRAKKTRVLSKREEQDLAWYHYQERLSLSDTTGIVVGGESYEEVLKRIGGEAK